MTRLFRWMRTSILALFLVGLATPSWGVIISTGTGQQTTPAPFGIDSYLVEYGNSVTGTPHQFFAGTAISADFAIVSGHGAPPNTDVVSQNGQFFHVAQKYLSPNSDFEIIRIDGASDATGIPTGDTSARFTSWAPLYTSGTETIGQALIMTGAGNPPGTPVLNGANQLQGWQWGGYPPGADRQISWGPNVYSGRIDLGTGFHDLYDLKFTPGGLGSTLSGIDSGGGLFILENGVWKLAGVNSAVNSQYYNSANANDVAFGGNQASLFDQTGYFVGDPLTNTIIPAVGPQDSYVTRLANLTDLNFIHSVTGIAVPEPASLTLLGLGLAGAFGLSRRRKESIPPTRE